MKSPAEYNNTINSSLATLYSKTTFEDDTGKEITLSREPRTSVIYIMLYTGSISSANRTSLLIPSKSNASFYAVATSATDFDILRIEQSSNKLTLISHRNTNPITISGVYEYALTEA